MDSDPLRFWFILLLLSRWKFSHSQYQMQHNLHLEEKAAKAEERKREVSNSANTYIEEFFKKRTLAKEKKSHENR